MGRVEGKIATGRTCLIVLASFFTSVFCQVFNHDYALMTQLKVVFYGSFFEVFS